jgi:hypothetical protein
MADAFDDTLDSLADVLTRGTAKDDYGIKDPGFVTAASGVPCKVSSGKGRPKEFKDGKKASISWRCIYMRPWPNGEGTATLLTHNHWLRVNNTLYDVMQIINPGEENHHLEVWCEVINA